MKIIFFSPSARSVARNDSVCLLAGPANRKSKAPTHLQPCSLNSYQLNPLAPCSAPRQWNPISPGSSRVFALPLLSQFFSRKSGDIMWTSLPSLVTRTKLDKPLCNSHLSPKSFIRNLSRHLATLGYRIHSALV